MTAINTTGIVAAAMLVALLPARAGAAPVRRSTITDVYRVRYDERVMSIVSGSSPNRPPPSLGPAHRVTHANRGPLGRERVFTSTEFLGMIRLDRHGNGQLAWLPIPSARVPTIDGIVFSITDDAAKRRKHGGEP